MIEGVYQGQQTAKAYGIAARELVKWSDVGKVALAAALASITLATSLWTSTMGLFGVVAAGCCFMAVYVPLLLLLRVPEALTAQGASSTPGGSGFSPTPDVGMKADLQSDMLSSRRSTARSPDCAS